jgi:EpsI family protein
MRRPDLRFLILNGILLFAVAGTVWANRTATVTAPPTGFLHGESLDFRGWKSHAVALTDREMDLLRPDAVMVRRFESPAGEIAELAVIAGHRKQTVHTPAYCLSGGGWETLTTGEWSLPIQGLPRGSSVEGTRAVMTDDGNEVIITYLFTDGTATTRSILRFQVEQLWTRLRGHLPMGALVRIIVPVTRDRESAVRLSDAFAAALLPQTLRDLRTAQKQGVAADSSATKTYREKHAN